MSDLFAAGSTPVITVSELNARARMLIERGMPLGWVAGEVSNFTRAASGHCYFTLKDADAQVRCAMFRSRAQLLDWVPGNGMQVEVRAVATVYEARGEFQLTVETLRRAGLGALYEAFERLKQKLAAEGLFAAGRKRPLPPFARAIGIVTSVQAAALRDVLTTLRRRMPSIPIIVYPTPVQGVDAAGRIAEALAVAGRRNEVDVLLLCRGGGSIEDLWSFNEEVVARAVVASPIPVVTGVGHETDFTIVDFVSDARAPTPTAAAELVSPDGPALRQRLARTVGSLSALWARSLERRMQRLDHAQRRLRHPGERLAQQRLQLGQWHARLGRAWRQQCDARRWRVLEFRSRLRAGRPDPQQQAARVNRLAERMRALAVLRLERSQQRLARGANALAHLDPRAVLQRGYGIVRTADGRIVRDANALHPGDALDVTLAQGGAAVTVTDVRKD